MTLEQVISDWLKTWTEDWFVNLTGAIRPRSTSEIANVWNERYCVIYADHVIVRSVITTPAPMLGGHGTTKMFLGDIDFLRLGAADPAFFEKLRSTLEEHEKLRSASLEQRPTKTA